MTLLSDWGLWRRPPAVADLVFPVIAVSGDESSAFVVAAPEHLGDPRPPGVGAPADGTVLIDSAFHQYVERRVRCKQGELTMVWRLLIGRPGPFTYRFDLRRCWRSGPAAAHARLARCRSFGGDAADTDRKRAAIATQATMAGILCILSAGAPAEVEGSGRPRATRVPPTDDAVERSDGQPATHVPPTGTAAESLQATDPGPSG